MRGRPWSWITGRPRLTDGLIVAFNLTIGLLALVGASSRYPISVIAALAVGIAIQAGALWWRRSNPIAVLLIVVSVELAILLISSDREPSGVGLAFAVYAVSVYDRSRVRLVVAGAAIVLILTAVMLLVLGDLPTSRILIPVGALSLVAWVIGDYVQARRQFFIELMRRHQKEREEAAEEERLRIARELHDVVAHNVSVMAIQAGAARMSGTSSRDVLRSIESTARATLSELNRLLGVLRKDSAAPLSPQPGLEQVDGLLKPAREAGLDATLKIIGEKRQLGATVDLSAYRIVQEAITNVLKHAQASRVEVIVGYEPDALVLTITDNGVGAGQPADASTGHGLVGMRERVDLFNGELVASSSSLGGFTVRAKLPTT